MSSLVQEESTSTEPQVNLTNNHIVIGNSNTNNEPSLDLGPPLFFDPLTPRTPLQRQITKSQEDAESGEISPNTPRVPLKRLVTKDTPADPSLPNINVLMIGTGEYTTGYVHDKPSDSDKSAGVVALTMFDLRARGKVNRLGLCGTNGSKFPGIRSHLHSAIQDVYSLDTNVETFPSDTTIDPEAYIQALASFNAGDMVTIFTPDDTHFSIAKEAISRGLHVLVTKPAVLTLKEHRELCQLAEEKRVLVSIEVHKRWDPIYTDARDRIQGLGPFSYFYSYMSQPKHQLETFKGWAGGRSDISYYLNSHHIDFHEWVCGDKSRPVRVTAIASTGVASERLGANCEDTITLTVQWENLESPSSPPSSSSLPSQGEILGPPDLAVQIHPISCPPSVPVTLGTAVYTSSWIAPKSDVHSQQRFFYMGQRGEVSVDQAHRGYSLSEDSTGFRSVNPLFMKYTPSGGKFVGQHGYGYRSFEVFVDAVLYLKQGGRIEDLFPSPTSPLAFHLPSTSSPPLPHSSSGISSLALLSHTYRTTAVLEAGRRSLDQGGRPVKILYESASDPCQPTSLE